MTGQTPIVPVVKPNGLAERFVQTFKQALRAAMAEKKPLSQKLANFLLAYRTTPHAMTGETPAMLLMGRNIRTRLDVLKPNIRKRVEEKQQDQELKSSHSPTRKLDVGEAVIARNYRGGNKWVPGIITAQSGPFSYEVRVAPNTVWRRHIDQLRESAITVNPNTDDPVPQPNPAVFLASLQSTSSGVPQTPTCNGSEEAVTPDKDISAAPDNPSSSQMEGVTSNPVTPCRRYPLRLRKPPERLNL